MIYKARIYAIAILFFVFSCQDHKTEKPFQDFYNLNEKLIEWDSICSHNPSGRCDSLLTEIQKIALLKKDKATLANIKRRQGNQWVAAGEFKAGIDTLLISLKFSEEIQDSLAIYSTLNNIGLIYDYENQLKIGLTYHYKALKRYELIKFNYGSADVARVISESYSILKNPDSAFYFANKAINFKLQCKKDQQLDIGDFYVLIAKACIDKNQISNSHKWLGIARKFIGPNHFSTLANINLLYAIINNSIYDKKAAANNLTRVATYLNPIKDIYEKSKIYNLLSNEWAKIPNRDSSYFYHIQFDLIKDSILNQQRLYAIATANGIYSVQKHEKENQLLKAELKSWLIGLSSGIILLLFTALYIYKNQQNKRKKILAETNLNINKILEEVNQSKMEAWADGQEKERSRLAGELHDRLGGLLVMASHHFTSIEKKFNIIKKENEVAFSDFRKIINNAIIEVRELSKDISSNLVSKLGLSNAMFDLKEKIEMATSLKVSLSIHDSDSKVPLTAEIALFRIAQEALNNIMKHARASEVQLSLTGNENSLILMIEDNGKGFDYSKNTDISGMGLKSMQKRMSDIGGTLNIDSKIGRGTVVVAEIRFS